MPIVAALPAIAAVAGTASAVKGLTSGSGGGPSYGAGPERAVNEAGAAKAYGNVESSLQNQQDFVNALNAANGIGNLSNTYNQLQGVANGTGPNPAKAMLNQATGTNVANTGALMAGQRGAGANAGLIARQAAQQGAQTQQQAVGQGATLQANQSLAALGQMGGIAGQQVGNQIAAGQGLTAAESNNYGQLLNQITSQNNTAAGLQANVNTNNTSAGINSANNELKAGGSLLNAAGPSLTPLFTPKPDQTATSPQAGTQTMTNGAGLAAGGVVQPPGPRSALGRLMLSGGGKVRAVVSPGERILSPTEAKQVASGHKKATQVGYNVGGKAKTSGDSTKNDTVKKDLTPGSVVVKRTKNMGDDVAEKATAFVRAVMAKGGRRG